MKLRLKAVVPALILLALIERAQAAEFEPLGKAVAGVLGTTKAFKKSIKIGGKARDVFYSKGSNGKAAKFAFVEEGVYEPNCTHTWVVGVDAKTAKVLSVRVVEMSCPHAYPTKAANFLDQYKGKGPADAAKLSEKVITIAKATGSSNLTTDAVKRSITAANKIKGKL